MHTLLEQDMNASITRKRFISLEELIMMTEKTIFTPMIYTQTNGIRCFNKERYHNLDLDQRVLRIRIAFTSLEDIKKNQAITIKTYSITICKERDGTKFIQQEKHLVKEQIIQQYSTKVVYISLEDMMENIDLETYTSAV